MYAITIWIMMLKSMEKGRRQTLSEHETNRDRIIKQFDESVGINSKNNEERQEKFINYKKELALNPDCSFSKLEVEELTLENWILAMLLTARSVYSDVYLFKGNNCYEYKLLRFYKDNFDKLKNEPELFFKMS